MGLVCVWTGSSRDTVFFSLASVNIETVIFGWFHILNVHISSSGFRVTAATLSATADLSSQCGGERRQRFQSKHSRGGGQ